MGCQSCGRATDGSPICQDCARRQDPYAVLSTPPAQGQSADPYLMTQHWTGQPVPPPPPPPTRRPNWPVAVAVVVVALAGMGFGLWWLIGGDRGDSAAVPILTPTPSEVATEAPSEPVETSTVFVTVEPTSDASAARTDPAPAGLDADSAVAAMNEYLAAVAGNPEAGWNYLTERRQQVEDWDSYAEFWSAVASASVTDCRFEPDGGALSCLLTTVDQAGKVATSQPKFWLTEENGQVRIDLAGGGDDEQILAEQTLDEYRRDWLPLTYDERWVAELSAKRPGISDPLQIAANGTHVFYFTDILSMHEDLVARFPDVPVMMLRRADWGKQGRDLWQTVADPGGLASREAVEAWCAAAFPELSGDVLTNQCTPRQMTAPHS